VNRSTGDLDRGCCVLRLLPFAPLRVALRMRSFS
jgi:hypothetical protein